MNSDSPDHASTEDPSSTEIGSSTPQYPDTVEKTFSLPEETLARIRAEAERGQTSESEALVKMVAAYQPGV